MALLAHILKVADRVTNSWSTRVGINLVLKRYGQMTQLKIDREAKRAEMELLLQGETASIRVEIGNYTVDRPADGPMRVTLKGIVVSRAWMQQAAKEFAEGKTFDVPADIAPYLAMIL